MSLWSDVRQLTRYLCVTTVTSNLRTRSLALAVIADRTVYSVYVVRRTVYWFRLQVDERLVRTIRFNMQVEFVNASKLNRLKRD